ASEQRIAQKVAPLLQLAGSEGAWARDLARDSAEGEALMRTTLARLAQQGEVHQVVKDLYYDLAQMRTLAGIARRLARQGEGQVQAADFRDATGLGRKRAIQLLEYFDRVGLLRRVGDVHRLRGESALFLDEGRADA
ncbi:MAG TPA: SelB C-terminal domain-containing protein, partial [Roseateles sp.]|nr:SelB C-terminal domain-containing protein [Roseateles sp.]